MYKKKKTNNHKLDGHDRIVLLAELTHRLTGEQESDIRGYLEKFGIQAFFARLDSSKTKPHIRKKICELYETFGKSE